MMIPGRNNPLGTQTPYVITKKKYQMKTKRLISPKVVLMPLSMMVLMTAPSVLNSRVANGLYWPSGQLNSLYSLSSSPLSIQCLTRNGAKKKTEEVAAANKIASKIFYHGSVMYCFLRRASLMLTKIRREPMTAVTIPMMMADGKSEIGENTCERSPNLRTAALLKVTIDPL